MNDVQTLNPTREQFQDMLDGYFAAHDLAEGKVVKGHVTLVEDDFVTVDIGLKTEGRIPVKEFVVNGRQEEIKPGDQVDVYIDRIENALGEAVFSRDKARKEETWERLEEFYKKNEPVNGAIFMRTRGGFYVDLQGVRAFLPGSQVDVRPVRDIAPLMNREQPFQVLKLDRPHNNIVVSRRAILEESRAEQRAELISQLHEGDVREGVVKNIVDYGAFVDLGGVDGLLHVTDMSWRRVTHPGQVLSQGETLKVQIIKINPETQRISLGIKQLQSDPWEGIVAKYPVGTKITGHVTNIADYGAFVELEEGVEGLIHVSEMSWVKKNVPPGKILTMSQEVEVMILEVDIEKRRISLGLKQTMDNPWEAFDKAHKPGTTIEGEVKSITEFGMFIGLEGDIDGMVHLSDLSWDESGEEALKTYQKGETIQARVLDIDTDKERISLGIKQLQNDPMEGVALKKGDTVTCTVSEVTSGGVSVTFGPDGSLSSFIRKSDLSRDRSEQRPERFAVGDKLDAMVTQADKRTRKISLSVKALEINEEQQAVSQYGSRDSGASLGDILGVALREQGEETEEEKTAQAESASPKKPKTKSPSKKQEGEGED